MVSTGGRGAVFAVMSTGPVNKTILGTASFLLVHQFGGLSLFW